MTDRGNQRQWIVLKGQIPKLSSWTVTQQNLWTKSKTKCANIIRYLWCFTLLMRLHDFVAELVNPEHIFHDAHTVPFCLTADHIATCHMFLCPHQVSTVLVCFWTRVVWKTFGTRDDGIWSHSWSPTRRVETRQLPWSPMDSEWRSLAASMESHGEVWWKRGSFHGVPWTVQFWMRGLVEWHDSWQRMQWYASSHSVSTAGNGCSGMHRLTVSRQLVLECPGLSIKWSICSYQWTSETDGERSVWETLRSCVLMEYHEFQFCLLSRLVLHRRVTAHPFAVHAFAWLTFLVLSHLSFAPRFIPMSSMSAWPLTGPRLHTHRPILVISIYQTAKQTEKNVERCRVRWRAFTIMVNVHGCNNECGDIHGK